MSKTNVTQGGYDFLSKNLILYPIFLSRKQMLHRREMTF